MKRRTAEKILRGTYQGETRWTYQSVATAWRVFMRGVRRSRGPKWVAFTRRWRHRYKRPGILPPVTSPFPSFNHLVGDPFRHRN